MLLSQSPEACGMSGSNSRTPAAAPKALASPGRNRPQDASARHCTHRIKQPTFGGSADSAVLVIQEAVTGVPGAGFATMVRMR
jgi:hypothetical protein